MNNWLKINQLLNFKYLLNLFFKQSCLLCGGNLSNSNPSDGNPSDEIGLCHACMVSLPYVPNQSCEQCSLLSNHSTCGSCLSNEPSFDKTHAVLTYDFPINAMMQRYKYGSQIQFSQLFGQLLSRKIDCSTVDTIIPMPMHPARLKERGFNQALEIAKNLTTSHKLDYKHVIRSKNTLPQASLPLKARAKNIRNAFQVSRNLTGQRIAIVDDVMTTGASLNELAKTLKKAGAAHVECWVVIRTLPKH